MMFRAMFVTGAAVLMIGNWFAGPSALVFAAFAGFAMLPKKSFMDFLVLRAVLEEAEREEREGYANTPAAKRA